MLRSSKTKPYLPSDASCLNNSLVDASPSRRTNTGNKYSCNLQRSKEKELSTSQLQNDLDGKQSGLLTARFESNQQKLQSNFLKTLDQLQNEVNNSEGFKQFENDCLFFEGMAKLNERLMIAESNMKKLDGAHAMLEKLQSMSDGDVNNILTEKVKEQWQESLRNKNCSQNAVNEKSKSKEIENLCAKNFKKKISLQQLALPKKKRQQLQKKINI